MSDPPISAVEYRQGIYYLVLDAGTPHDRGYQHDAALRFPIKTALRQFRTWLRDVVGLADPEEMIHDFAVSTPYLASVRDGAPDLFEEMEGIAGGAGVDPNHLFAYQSFDELFLFLRTSGAVEASTTGHGTTAGITLEAFQQIFKTRPILVHPGRPTGRTLVNLVAVIAQQSSPILYLTPDSPSLYSHARFTF